MAFKPNEVFWAPKNFQSAQRIMCFLHNEWVNASWELKNPGTPAQVYDVTCTAVKHNCNSHLGATDIITITKAAWESTPADHIFYCFEP